MTSYASLPNRATTYLQRILRVRPIDLPSPCRLSEWRLVFSSSMTSYHTWMDGSTTRALKMTRISFS